jgi:hypothetical protein
MKQQFIVREMGPGITELSRTKAKSKAAALALGKRKVTAKGKEYRRVDVYVVEHPQGEPSRFRMVGVYRRAPGAAPTYESLDGTPAPAAKAARSAAKQARTPFGLTGHVRPPKLP